MTLPQIGPQGFSDWGAAVTNAIGSLVSSSGLPLGYIHQTNMPDVAFDYDGLEIIPGLAVPIIVPDSGLVEVQMQTLTSHGGGASSEYIHVGVSLDFGITTKREIKHYIYPGAATLTSTMMCDVEPGSSVTVYGGVRSGANGLTGTLYRSSGAECLMVVRAL